MILEVGIGGRLDAVNHFSADLALVVSISRDHQAILGERYEQILWEKLGICRSGKHLITQFKLKYLCELTKGYASTYNIEWNNINADISQSYFKDNQDMAVEAFLFFYPKLNHPNRVDLAQLPNFKGRREEMTINGNSFIFIGAHNTDGMRKMIDQVLMNPVQSSSKKILVSFSKRPHKELIVMCKTLSVLRQNGYQLELTFFDHPKAVSKEAIEYLLRDIGNKGLFNFVEDWKSHIHKSKGQVYLVCGSYYFIGEVQSYLHSNFS